MSLSLRYATLMPTMWPPCHGHPGPRLACNPSSFVSVSRAMMPAFRRSGSSLGVCQSTGMKIAPICGTEHSLPGDHFLIPSHHAKDGIELWSFGLVWNLVLRHLFRGERGDMLH